ncbi:Stigma-specific Stig1 family protein, putative [Theobroma cacao]|uniref:Stigma-specific Stig1 family protein, putative n=1 Tax=Theobroma cacao TaxID=3641 RepID=A0A061F5G7_THECC|nr:Stigma-specific Stig1 family protein, putative [Theobroma cacao]
MKFIKLLFASILVMVLVLSIAATASLDQQDDTDNKSAAEEDDNDAETKQRFMLDETEGRSLLQKKRTRRLNCNKFPRICHARGSPGPQCCKKKCVNILMDRLNCGKCGKKCKYNEICCKGKCVNPSFNRKHCGGCNNRCSNGELCVFGLCNYA